MFGSKQDQRPQKRIDSLIGVGTVIDGNVQFAGGLRIDGVVHGDVSAAGDQAATLVVSEQARIDGEIRVSHIVINGTVNGPIYANDFLELQSKAKVKGDTHYKVLEMHLGATIEGQMILISAADGGSVVELKRGGGNPN
jgi:cytoskeletal protein CcmA (bactofilin family)